MKAVLCTVALLAVAACLVQAQPRADTGSVAITYDNRGVKTMSADNSRKIITALANYVFLVDPSQVKQLAGIGQSTIFNHQSVVTYQATGPTKNGKTVLANCRANIKSGFFRRSAVKKSINKATNSWLPFDSVKVQKAVCA